METQFEPMGVGRILDRSFFMYRKNFLRFLTIVAVIQIPMALVGLLVMESAMSGSSAPPYGLAMANGLLALVGQVLCAAALIKFISASYLGEDLSVGQVYRAILPKILPLLGASIMVGLVVGVGILLLIVPGVIFLLWYSLTSQTIVTEDIGAFAGMTRSKELARGNLGKIFLVALLVWLINTVAGLAMSNVGGLVAGTPTFVIDDIEASMAAFSRAARIQHLFTSIGTILIMPITAGAYVFLYYDLRIRKEGFDLEMLAKSMGAAAPEQAQTPPDVPPLA